MTPEDSYDRSNLATAVNALPLPISWKDERLKPDAIELVRQAVAEEREACAVELEKAFYEALLQVAARIRARGQ